LSDAIGNSDQPALTAAGIPGPFEWEHGQSSWSSTATELTIVSGRHTNWFASPTDARVDASAPLLLFRPTGDFVLSARVTVDYRSLWDAGFLMVYVDDRTWAKFALEVSAYNEPTIVSVVTRGISDDCNSALVDGKSIRLRVARTAEAFLYYAAPAGQPWKLVRAFRLSSSPDLRVGFASQSPIGEGCGATFAEIAYERRTISDIYKGE
jgi:regulation of enolase protein 1 (concanavalin A-like superfamily)